MILAVVFDMDGTLLDSIPAVSGAYASAIRDLGGPSVSAEEVVVAWHVGHTSLVLEHFLNRQCGAREVDCFHHHLDAAADAIQPFAGITELLESLRGLGIQLAVFTAANRRATDRLLTAAGLRRHFPVVVAGDEVGRPKPAPDGLRLARRRLDVPATSTAYIGDAEVDLGCADRDKVLGIHAAWGAQPGVRVGASPVARKPQDLLAFVGQAAAP